jgi:HAMP domain-containing protein
MGKPMNELQTTKQARFISLRVKLLFGFTLLFGIIVGGIYYWFYRFAIDIAMHQIEADMVNTLEAAIDGIDGDEFVALATEGKSREDGLTDDPRYWRQLDWLNTIHKIEPRAWPYTYVRGNKPKEVLFIGDILVITDPGRASGFRQPYTTVGPMFQGLTDLTLKMTPYSDEWGSWVSAYKPILNSKGEKVGALGLDFRADYVFQVQRAILDKVVVAFVITYITLFILVFVISGTLTRPIITLTRAAERIGEGDYAQDLSHLTKDRFPDEIDTLAKVFSIMVGKVYQREQTLRRQVEELRIEIDEVKRQRQVREIVETDFFQDLQARARTMRSRSRRPAQSEKQGEPGDTTP